MNGPDPRSGDDAAAEYDVMTAEPMGGDDDEGFEWDANEMSRGQGEAESEPLDDLDEEDDDEEELEAEPEDEDDGQDEDEDEEGEDEGEEDDGIEPIEPPSNWPAGEKQWFKALPPQMQQAYMARAQHMVADYTRKTQALAQRGRQIESLERVIAPHVQNWRLNGMHPDQAIGQLIELSDFASRDPKGFIQYFSKLRGVDLQSFNQEQEYIDPQVAALQRPVAEVQAQLNQLRQHLQQSQIQQQQQAYSAAFNSTNAALDDIAQQADETGRPLYPFFNEVEGDMAALIESGYARSIPEAYSKAVKLNDQVRAKIAARSRQEQNARMREQTQRARRAASSLTGASNASNGAYSNGDMSLRDTLNAAWQGNL